MPIRPEEIDPSKLPTALRGYQRAATEELLKRVAWDYRQALRVEETWTRDQEHLREQIAELEALVASQRVEFAGALANRDAKIAAASSSRSEAQEAEMARLQRLVHQHERRRDLTQTLLHTAQRSAQELRESARQDAESLLKAAQRRAAEIEHGARAGARHATSEIERLQRLETDLRDRLRETLQSVIGENSRPAEQPSEPSPEADSSVDHS
jgi:cell division septum initiation protein DivIVA